MPTADLNASFGRIISRRDVELAVVAFLQSWVPTYIAEIERQAQLPARTLPLPPDTNLSYRGGLDFNTWEQGWSPVYIAVVQKDGSPERYDAGRYLQPFRITCACNVVITDQMVSLSGETGGLEEDSARQYADMYGMAACAAILQHGGLGLWPDGTTVSLKTVMASYPATTFPYEDRRSVTRSTFEVVAYVDSVLTEADGPVSPLITPYFGAPDYAQVESVNLTLESEDPAGDVSTASPEYTVDVTGAPPYEDETGTVTVD